MTFIIPISLIILFVLIRKYYKWKAWRGNEKRKKALKKEIDRIEKEEIDFLLDFDEHEKAISN